jgi:hypothetical protein
MFFFHLSPKSLILSLSFLLTCRFAPAQQRAQVAAVGFYNFENLFDTEDDPDKKDEEFTPDSRNRWTQVRYHTKLQQLAQVVSELGTELTPDGLALLGVAEVENRQVLADFALQPKVRDRSYQIIHYDSPDRRGIDVALLYNPKYFTPLHSEAIPAELFESNGDTIYTRDILYVSGILLQDTLHLLVNHWPSRRGGQKASEPGRMAMAMKNKRLSDSLRARNPEANILIMGDLNDDPVNRSVKKVLDATNRPDRVSPKGFFNPMYDLFKQGIGTLAYRDAWSLFDQILVSPGLLSGGDGLWYYSMEIFNPPYLQQQTGDFQGYPLRTYGGGTYLGGYSDHFPVYIYLIRKMTSP